MTSNMFNCLVCGRFMNYRDMDEGHTTAATYDDYYEPPDPIDDRFTHKGCY